MGIDITNMALKRIASSKFPFSKVCMARCEPQPGHLYPVIIKNWHFGKKL